MTEVSTSPRLERRASELVSRSDRSFLVRAAHAPATWLLILVGVSALVRFAIVSRVAAPWILPDEIVYSELAKSIADGGRPAIRGVPVFGWGEVYPTLIAPAWASFHDPITAYRAALSVNAVVMSLAAVPAYFLARLFLARPSSLLVAAMTVLVPSMAYTGVVMTENAFYPVFLLAVLMISRSVRSPTIGNQALALLALVLVAFTRIQGLALVGAYIGAILVYGLTGRRAELGSYLRRFFPSCALAVTASLAPAAASLARGDGALGWLGARSGTFNAFHAHEVPQWFVFLAADLVLYVAVVPVAATVVLVGRGLRRDAAERTRLFAAVALPTLLAMLFSVSLVSASLDVDGTENLNERYVFYVVPLLFVGLALWIRDRLPRPHPWASVTVGVCCLLAALLPIDRLEYNAAFQSLGLLPWLALDAPSIVVALLVVLFVLACGGFWLTCSRRRVGFLWLVVGFWMAMTGTIAVVSNLNSATNSASAFEGLRADWVDRAVPDGAGVSLIWRQGPEHRALTPEFWMMVTEFFNPSIGSVYRLGAPTYYEGFLPTIAVDERSDGRLTDRGLPIDARYVLVTCRTPIVGTVVARAPRGLLELVEVDPPLRLERRGRCSRPS
jgi:hypothetical protein